MSRLDELIAEYCPDGVEYRSFGEIAEIIRGASPRPIKNYITTDMQGINWIKIGDVKPGEKYISKTEERITPDGARKSRLLKPGDFILSNSMSFGRPYILKIAGCIHDGWLAIQNYQQYFDTEFLYFLLNSNSIQTEMKKRASFGGAVQNLNADIVRALVLPVPPQPVQREIVCILDSFTARVVELQERLTAELIARNKQYEYYRNLLLSSNDVEWMRLPQISTNCDRQRKPVTKGKREAGIYPYYGASGIVDYVAEYLFDGDFLLVSEDGANLLARSTPIAFSISGKNWVNNHAHVLKFESSEMRKYVEMYLNSIDLSKFISGGAQPKLNQDNLNKIPIPVPTPEKVKRIVDVLLQFDTLCADMKNGLPAEIEARQKQYEYYRDKLLSFKEKRTV